MKIVGFLLKFFGIVLLIVCVRRMVFQFPEESTRKQTIKLGIDVLEECEFDILQGKRVGILTNQSGVDSKGELTWKILKESSHVNLRAIFAPVHGLEGNYMSLETFYNDEVDDIPVYSVFASNSRPKDTWLKGLDTIVIDLQDIGIRYYNYWAFMIYMMAACFENDIEVIVLDRPNPLGGHYVGGPTMEEENASAWGPIVDLPLFHGMTIGELARYCKNIPEGIIAYEQIETGVIYSGLKISPETLTKGKLAVIPMKNWRRDMLWEETGLKWVKTSPYIVNLQSVYEYAFTALSSFVSLGFLDTCNFLKFEPAWSQNLPLHTFSSRYVVAHSILQYLEEEIFKKQNGFSLSLTGRLKNSIEIKIKDIRKVQPGLFGLAMLAFSQKYTHFYISSEENYHFLGAHIGDSELLEKLSKMENIDVSYFKEKWHKSAQRFIEKSKAFYLYE